MAVVHLEVEITGCGVAVCCSPLVSVTSLPSIISCRVETPRSRRTLVEESLCCVVTEIQRCEGVSLSCCTNEKLNVTGSDCGTRGPPTVLEENRGKDRNDCTEVFVQLLHGFISLCSLTAQKYTPLSSVPRFFTVSVPL